MGGVVDGQAVGVLGNSAQGLDVADIELGSTPW